MTARRQARAGRRAGPPALPIEVQIDHAAWRRLGGKIGERVRRAAAAALARAKSEKKQGGGLTILLTGNDQVQVLNRKFRGKDKPTNVLSFPAREEGYLGDIAIAHDVAAGEAEAAGLTLTDHLLHLTVHGVLHLLGYDHERSKDAEIMEALEADILADMDIANPYLRRGCAA
jgi:probable rRNA maturation factor